MAETKCCTRCGKEKPITEFSWQHKVKGTRKAWCKICQATQQREYYKKNNEREKQRDAARKRELRRYVAGLKKECGVCGRRPPEVGLLFHHWNPAQKEIKVSLAVSRKWTKAKIDEEIEKCNVLCFDCHAKEHRAMRKAQRDKAP